MRSSLLVALMAVLFALNGLGTPFRSDNIPTYGSVTPVLPETALKLLGPLDASWVLKTVAIGLGTQNYTCTTSSTAAPASNGAVADLYDGWSLFTGSCESVCEEVASHLKLSSVPGPLSYRFRLPLVGRHDFQPGLVPTFRLFNATPSPFVLSAKKVAGVPAPANPCGGLPTGDAIDWLHLADREDGKTTPGIKAAYRVDTVLGKAPATCEGLSGEIVVPYGAAYFFYGVSL